MNNTTIDINTISALLGMLFLVLNAVIASFFAVIVWTWRASDFKNNVRTNQLLTDNKIIEKENRILSLEKVLEEQESNYLYTIKEIRKLLGNNGAELQHIKNYLIRISSKGEFDTFTPIDVRKRED